MESFSDGFSALFFGVEKILREVWLLEPGGGILEQAEYWSRFIMHRRA